MSGGSQTSTTVQKADPWSAAQPALKDAIGTAEQFFSSGQYAADPYSGQTIAGFGDTTQQAQDMVMDRAEAGAPLVEQASGTLSSMMDGNYQSELLNSVKENALGSAVPAAASMFSGSGMTNSSQAMDTVGRAATEAVAPIEYGAFENAQARAMSAAGMAPQMEAAGYMPAQMIAGVGQAEDALAQANIDADVQNYYASENQDINNFQGYLSNLTALGGMGGSTSATGPSGQPSSAAQIASAGLGGLGAYGALAGIPGIGAPMAIGGGLLAGLAGVL